MPNAARRSIAKSNNKPISLMH